MTTPLPTGGCGAKDIYDALLNTGFSTVQAIGVMANAIAESSLDPEVHPVDSNGAVSNGLWQFNEASYPDSGKLITGDCAVDIVQQVGYLKSHVSGSALNGSTGAEVAGNFASNFERCQGCGSGGASFNQRVANAATVQGWISSGKWPTSSVSSGTGGAQKNSPAGAAPAVLTSAQAAACVWSLNIPLAGQFCVISKSQARGLIGGLLIIAGGLLVLPGLLVLAAAGLERTGAGRAAGQAAAALPVGRVAKVAGLAGG